MKVTTDGYSAIINDTLIVRETDGFLQFDAVSGSLPPFSFGAPQPEKQEVEYDETYYYNGRNGLTLNESAYDATEKVKDNLRQLGYDIGDEQEFFKAAKELIRRADNGRQAVYVLAGNISNGYRRGLYQGVPFSFVFKGFVEGSITEMSGVYSGSYAIVR